MNDRTTTFDAAPIHDITGLAASLTGTIATVGGRLMAVGADSTGYLSKEDVVTELSNAASEVFRDLAAAQRDLRYMREQQQGEQFESLSLGVAVDDARRIAVGLLKASQKCAGFSFRSEAIELLRKKASEMVVRDHAAGVLEKLAELGCRLYWPKPN